MNERIQELAYQAEDYADSIVDQGGEFHSAYTRKFAELIVRECTDALNTMPQYYKTEHDKQIERNTICDSVRTILEHFGLEE